jgi:hypothetical protein
MGDVLHCVEGGEEDAVEPVIVKLSLGDLAREASDQGIVVLCEAG